MLRVIHPSGAIEDIAVSPEYTRVFLDGRKVGQFWYRELARVLNTDENDISTCTTVDSQSYLVYSIRAMESAQTNQTATNLSPFTRIAGDVLMIPLDESYDQMEGGR